MNEKDWERMNYQCHKEHGGGESDYNSSQRWFNQALMLNLLSRHGVIAGDDWLDYASGEGNLSIQLKEHFNKTLWNYDKYMEPRINSTVLTNGKTYDLVVNGAFLEHVRTRRHLEALNECVSQRGVLAIHTLVREDIPEDPDWFYLLPVHTAFHTNRSMQLLMEQWGYTCSAYNEHAQLWVMFKSDPKTIHGQFESLNSLMGWECFKFKVGFMDYWS